MSNYSIEQIANTLSQVSYVLSSEGDSLTIKDLDAMLVKLSKANDLLFTVAENKRKELEPVQKISYPAIF